MISLVGTSQIIYPLHSGSEVLDDSVPCQNRERQNTAPLLHEVWLFRPFAVSTPGFFAPWLIRSLTLDDSLPLNKLSATVSSAN